MTRGRSGDRTYTGHNGARESVLRDKAKLAHAPAGTAGGVALAAQFRAFIEAGQCPFCGESFRNIAAHTNRTHGVDRHELKEIAGIPKSRPACSPEFSETLGELRRRDMSPEHLAKLREGADARAARREKRSFSEAGKVAQRAKLAKVDRIEAGATAARRYYESTADRDRSIVARLDAGESSESIQRDLGISGPTVRRALGRLGDGRDLRADAGRRRPVPREAMQEGARKVALKRRSETLAKFLELGGDWSALCVLAEDLGTSRKALRTYLVTRCGVRIDGRSR